MQEAFDLSREPERVRERDGRSSTAGQSMLLARRLVERGARFVTVHSTYGVPWDSHENNFPAHRNNIPAYDHTISALLGDLELRAFSRRRWFSSSANLAGTPRINNKAGRDHWPACYTCVLAGGGVRRGVIVGASDNLGELPRERPIAYQDVLATMYHLLGIDFTKSYLNEANRPVAIVNYGQPVARFSA